jgi:type II secretory pathway pseudopilin PulG
LVELVTVVVILGVIAAIAIPRVSMFGETATEASLQQSLAIMTKAVQHYRAEHDGAVPANQDQLLKYTNRAGTTSDTPSSAFPFGPYISKMPALTLGSRRGETGISASDTPGASDGGWVVNDVTGQVRANLGDGELASDGSPLNALGAGELLRK